MLSREERIVSELLLSRGRVSKDALESAVARLRETSSTDTLVDALVKDGKLARDAATRISDEARAIDAMLTPEKPENERLGDFRLVREIGRGGMGVVYEAIQDPLGRRVALKVLPSIVAMDERPAIRFLREARVVAGLDHPGIVKVLTSGQVDGRLFYAMDLVKGEDLRARLEKGALAPEEAARIAAEVARALAHAHEAGLVHRDVKPANVLLDESGRVRIMDFGLAKESHAGTVTLSHHVLGTPAFMAPEQARGEEVDARSDVYGVGALLYAMLAGRPPYAEELPSLALAHLLTREPDPLASVRPDLPPGLIEVCERAMARDPNARHASAAELAEELEGPTVAKERSSTSHVATIAILGVVVVAVALFWILRGSRAPAPPPGKLVAAPSVATAPGLRGSLSISADGNRVVYGTVTGEQGTTFVQELDGGAPVAVESTGIPVTIAAALSPDGASAAFCGRGLSVADLESGGRRTLNPGCGEMSWSPDGKELAVVLDRRLQTLSIADGATRVISSRLPSSPSWSPNGRRIAVAAVVGSRWDVVTMRPDGGDVVSVTNDAHEEWSPVWSSDGGTLYFGSYRDGRAGLWRVAIDEASGELGSEPESLPFTMAARFTMASARDRDRLAIAPRSNRDHVYRVGFDSGPAQVTAWPPRSPAPNEPSGSPSPAPSGKGILVVKPFGDASGLALMAPGADGESPGERWRVGPDYLPREDFDPGMARWSPDGRHAAFDGLDGARRRLWLLDVNEGTITPLAIPDEQPAVGPVWSPDGKRIAFRVPGEGWSIGLLKGDAGLRVEKEVRPSSGLRALLLVSRRNEDRRDGGGYRRRVLPRRRRLRQARRVRAVPRLARRHPVALRAGGCGPSARHTRRKLARALLRRAALALLAGPSGPRRILALLLDALEPRSNLDLRSRELIPVRERDRARPCVRRFPRDPDGARRCGDESHG